MKSERAHLGQRRETTGFTNDSAVETNRLRGISSILTLRWSEMGSETHHHLWRSRFTFFIQLIKPKELVSNIPATFITLITYALIRYVEKAEADVQPLPLENLKSLLSY
jgi:hypothetical protein